MKFPFFKKKTAYFKKNFSFWGGFEKNTTVLGTSSCIIIAEYSYAASLDRIRLRVYKKGETTMNLFFKLFIAVFADI
ncbi:MAG: hypothetical protein IKW66_02450, partial [Clostridia bacterium]|nr:hypothetical protein [Clostridia bacterium]